MRKREREGKILVLVSNVNNNFDLFLKSEEVISEQIEALNLQEELTDVHWSYKINFLIDGKKIDSKKTNGGTISKGCGF